MFFKFSGVLLFVLTFRRQDYSFFYKNNADLARTASPNQKFTCSYKKKVFIKLRQPEILDQVSRNDSFLGCIEALILTLINPNRDVHFTLRPIPCIEKNKTEIFTYKTILVLSMCCCFAAVVIKTKHRAGQRCFELLALIGSPQLSLQRYSQLNKHLGLTGKP